MRITQVTLLVTACLFCQVGVYLLKRRSALKAICNDPATNVESACPATDCVRNSISSKKASTALIIGLLAWRGPSAVAWLVISIVIDAIKRGASGTRSHIQKERLERIYPLWGNANTSTSPFWVLLCRFAQTPIFHGCPRFVFSRMTQPVSTHIDRRTLALKASTGLRMATIEFAGWHKGFGPAFANGNPFENRSSVCVFGLWSTSGNSKSPELFAS